MINVLNCIVTEHNLWLVATAGLICALGSWTVIRLFQRALQSSGAQFLGWLFLTAVAAGTSIWCTHFIAMLAFDPGVAVELDFFLTFVSLVVAMVGAGVGAFIAARIGYRFAPLLGGATIGLTIATMHYIGMVAYRVEGIVEWQVDYLVASIILSVVFSASAFHIAMDYERRSRHQIAAGLLAFGVISLHFTGMTAFQVTPLAMDGSETNPAALETLAFAIAIVAFIVVSTGIASYIIDTNQRQVSYKQLRHMAMTDALTQLPNRTHFNSRLGQEINRAQGADGSFALISIDLNGFKEINDTHGHGIGDKVLLIVGQRFANKLNYDEFVGRVGGDEFLAIIKIDDEQNIEDFLSRVRRDILATMKVEGYRLKVGASFGIACYPQDGQDKETLINNADLALYRAKSEIGPGVCYYEPSMDEMHRKKRALAADLRRAIANEELTVFYQPQVCIETGRIRGYEALLRWNHSQRGPISPAEFIPLAEKNGLIIQIGEWVLRQACREAARWSRDLTVAVNLSPIQFNHASLTGSIAAILEETGLSPARLELELTETAVIDHSERSQTLVQDIKKLGVSIALDDFGTGYSSLYTLKHFPFDKIKLDRSFVCNIDTDQEARAIVRTVLELGKTLSIPVLAEGIETEGQLRVLSDEGCDLAQGYYFGKPAAEILQQDVIAESVTA